MSAILTRSVYLPYIPRRCSVSQDVKLTFPRRGHYSQEALQVSTLFPFGLVCKSRNISCGQEVLVLPNVHSTEKSFKVLPLVGNEIDSYLKGRSHDLYAIRDYQQSDSARHVDWKATARVQQLKVREFTREEERRIILVFDRRIPDDRPQTIAKFEKAVTLCACLAWQLHELGATMRFVTGDFETPSSPASAILFPVLEELAVIEPAVTDGRSPAGFLWSPPELAQGLQIVLTFQQPESVAASQWRSTYFVFMDSL